MSRVKNSGTERKYGATPNERTFSEGMINWLNQCKYQTSAVPNIQIVYAIILVKLFV
jgi:hypothetical protein